MPKKTKALMTVIFFGIFLVVPASAIMMQDEAEAPELVEAMPNGEGRGIVRSVCSTCHILKKTLIERRNKEEWEITVDAMNRRGALLSSDEFEIVVSYLVEHYGPVEATGSAPEESLRN